MQHVHMVQRACTIECVACVIDVQRQTARALSGWDYKAAIAAMKAGAVAAVIADDTILLPEANTAADCELHVVQEQIEEYDLALAFRRTFDEPALLDSINLELLYLLQNGSLEVRMHKQLPY